MSNTTLTAILVLILAAIIIGIGPLLTIWALNTIFNTSIAYTFYTWAATLILQLSLKSLLNFRSTK